MTEAHPHVVSQVKSFIAGGCGGACVVLVGHPFDTVKVRLQTMPRPSPSQPALYNGAVDCVIKSIKSRGISDLYKGMGAPIASVTPIFAISFYGKPELVFAGMFSGLFTTAITAPVERIKCLLQVQSHGHASFNGPFHVIRTLYESGGLKSLYRGSCATLLRDIPGSAVFFPTYEWMKEILSPNGHVTIHNTLLAGGCAGMLAWMVSLPPDVLKSRYQIAPEGFYKNGIRSVLYQILIHEGPLALFRGASVVMLRAFPANAACFFGYEMAMKQLDHLFPNW